MATLNFKTYLSCLREKGDLAYEYNPFHNYLTNEDLYLYEDFIIPENKAVNKLNGEILRKVGNEWRDKYDNVVEDVITWNLGALYARKGSLIDLDTTQFNFDINHPVDIEVQPSYDGSVNLILNDDKNVPRIINSRFSPREKNTYEIVDRIGENDTNIYSSNNFDKDTSLYFLYNSNPIIEYKGLIPGDLPVGQYCFYFTYCDADNNESDFIAESGLIPAFIGKDKDPYSIDGGIKNQNSNKGIKLKLTNLDTSYNYIKVYYIRYFADYQLNRVYECKKLDKKFSVNSNLLTIQIIGTEEAEDIDANLLNITHFNPQCLLALAQCKNMLFFGNIVKNADNYKELQDCALRIIPKLEVDKKFYAVNNEYSDSANNFGYYNSLNIYNKTGYLNKEYYRFGVVFIYNNGTLSNVYNTLGFNISEDDEVYCVENSMYASNKNNSALLNRQYIKINEEGWIINEGIFNNSNNLRLNSRGVCKLNYTGEIDVSDNNDKINEATPTTIFGIKFSIPDDVISYLKEQLGIRGLFFVRLKRVPNILAQCYILPMDKSLEAPVIPLGKDTARTECFITQTKYRTITPLFNGLEFKIEEKGSREIRSERYSDRILDYGYKNTTISLNGYAAICPDFLLNLPYYNQIFNGGEFRLEQATEDSYLEEGSTERFYVESSSKRYKTGDTKKVKICSVTEDVSAIALGEDTFKLEVGKAEEAFRFKYARENTGEYKSGEEDFDKINKATNIVRGIYSPYLAIQSSAPLKYGTLYNIYRNQTSNTIQEYQIRMDSSEPFYAISDRFNFENLKEEEISINSEEEISIKTTVCWRGDCYINTFTYRLNRNFNDSSLPNNDLVIDPLTWKNNYDASNLEKWKDISRSDINAVKLGSWITISVRSSFNYALRSEDFSYVSERALMGAPRSFFPRKLLMQIGNYKMPDSYLYNDAYRASLGFKCYFTLQDINYIKNSFSNRIQYSEIAIQDSFKNNYRSSLSTYFRDYSTEYGGITKLVGFEGYLLVIFEHGIGIAVINERVLAGNGDGEPVFINTNNVLPEELTIISDTYGTQWSESIVKSEAGYVYGVDTVAKKIWRVKGQLIEILSDFKVNKFLVDNISLGEKEKFPILGIKNVKTHYNNNKKDIMFTFYDDVYKDEEKVWNLCYNELLGLFVTFYSWVPSYSENIDTQFFTFNRDTSKALSLLDLSNYGNASNTGIVLNSPILLTFTITNDDENSEILYYFESIDKTTNYESIDEAPHYKSLLGCEIHYRNYSTKEECTIENIEILRSTFAYNKYFEIVKKIKKENNGNKTTVGWYLKVNENYINSLFTVESTVEDWIILRMKENDSRVITLYLLPEIKETVFIKAQLVAVTFDEIVKNKLLEPTDYNIPNLTTDFYLHGNSGIIDISEDWFPTHWYGKTHPFEFEFIVNDKIGQLKIFTDLVLISNKAEPESFHFEIEGDNYEFSSDKRNMYFRLEATKNLYLNLGSDMLYNRFYTDVMTGEYTKDLYYRKKLSESEYLRKLDRLYPTKLQGLVQQTKSTIFPLYYERIDTFNDIEYLYQLMHDEDGIYDFLNLSGSEISWNRDLNQFNVITHIKNSPIDLVGRLRGNSHYKEGKWNIQIPSIIFMLKNEENWPTAYRGLRDEGPFVNSEMLEIKVPPIVINSQKLPKISDVFVNLDTLPEIYIKMSDLKIEKYIEITNGWTSRKEARIRDKWMKVRVRYNGNNLAVIHSLITLYNISYS